MPKYRKSDDPAAYVYPRERRGVTRFYADFRAFAAEGGKLEPMKPAPDAPATTDHAAAVLRAKTRLEQLCAIRALNVSSAPADRRFAAFAAEHLKQKAINEEANVQWLESAERHLTVACAFFGPSTDIATIPVKRVSEFVEYLRTLPNGRSAFMKNGTINHYLNSLSNMFNRAICLSHIELGKNPVMGLFTRPKRDAVSTIWLEVPEVAAILNYAKEWRSPRSDLAIPYLFEILPMFFFTGCREAEVFGMRLSDVDFERKIIRVAPNEFRRVKTTQSTRTVPLFPELEVILRAYLDGPFAPTGQLLFPAWNPGEQTDVSPSRVEGLEGYVLRRAADDEVQHGRSTHVVHRAAPDADARSHGAQRDTQERVTRMRARNDAGRRDRRRRAGFPPVPHTAGRQHMPRRVEHPHRELHRPRVVHDQSLDGLTCPDDEALRWAVTKAKRDQRGERNERRRRDNCRDTSASSRAAVSHGVPEKVRN